MPLFLAGMQIGGKVATTLLAEKNPKLARNINTLVGSFTTGAQTVSSLAGAFKSPKIGSELSKSTVGGLSKSDGSIMSRIIDMGKGGHLTQPSKFGLGNSMTISSSGIFDAFDKGGLSHNPLDLFS